MNFSFKMLQNQKSYHIKPKDVTKVYIENYFALTAEFYETQSLFMTGIHKRYKNLETANIVLFFAKSMHLEILRQREKYLDFDLSHKNLWSNIQNIKKPEAKIVEVVNATGIPKETVRRKIKILQSKGYLIKSKSIKGYSWNLFQNQKENYYKIINEEVESLAKLTLKFSKSLNLNFNLKKIEDEIKSEFSFYWYHFLSCQLDWMRFWQSKLKDIDLILIALQSIVPMLRSGEKFGEKISYENFFHNLDKSVSKINLSDASINASSVADIIGFPRATCNRKLEKLNELGLIDREKKTKRYFINQNLKDKSKNIITPENVSFTINTFGYFLAKILNNLIKKK